VTTIGFGALATVNIVLAVGADNVYRFRFEEPVGGVYAPVDLTGWTAAAQVRSNKPDTTVLVDMSDHIVLTSEGDVSVTLPASVTVDLSTGGLTQGVWDLELTETAGGRVVRLVEGKVTISQDVTRL